MEPLIAACVNDESPTVRENAEQSLRKLGDQQVAQRLALERLIARLKDKSASSDDRASVVDAVVKIGQPAVGPLIACFSHDDIEVQQLAADALSKIGLPAVEPLIAHLDDTDKNVRGWSLNALSRLHDAAATNILLGLLGHPHSDVRCRAVDALGKIGGEAVIARLSDEWLKERAGESDSFKTALENGGTLTIAKLCNNLETLDPNHLEEAKDVLRNLALKDDRRSHKELISTLAARLIDQHGRVLWATAWAVKEILSCPDDFPGSEKLVQELRARIFAESKRILEAGRRYADFSLEQHVKTPNYQHWYLTSDTRSGQKTSS